MVYKLRLKPFFFKLALHAGLIIIGTWYVDDWIILYFTMLCLRSEPSQQQPNGACPTLIVVLRSRVVFSRTESLARRKNLGW